MMHLSASDWRIQLPRKSGKYRHALCACSCWIVIPNIVDILKVISIVKTIFCTPEAVSIQTSADLKKKPKYCTTHGYVISRCHWWAINIVQTSITKQVISHRPILLNGIPASWNRLQKWSYVTTWSQCKILLIYISKQPVDLFLFRSTKYGGESNLLCCEFCEYK